MKLELSADYYELASEWQKSLTRLLEAELCKRGIDPDTAQDICGDFIFNVSMLHDQGEIKHGSAEYNPRICFHDFNESLLSIDEDTYLHEFAFKSVATAFDD